MENRTTGLVCLYIMGAVTMLLGLLGAYGAYKEHKISLIVVSAFSDEMERCKFGVSSDLIWDIASCRDLYFETEVMCLCDTFLLKLFAQSV